MKILLALAAVMAVMAAIKIIRHERRQDSEIQKLREEVQLLMAKTENNSEAESFTQNCLKTLLNGGVNYLAIGNSITLHGLCDYWWSKCGMAASEPSMDYVHIVTEEIRKYNKSVNSYAYSDFYVWEIMTHDRAEAITLLDSYLNESINIITIQLGENVLDLSTLESDYEYLLMHIKQKSPNAQIITVSDFWNKGERDNMKIKASEKCGVHIADISAIKENPDYMCGIDSKVKGDDGEMHIVKHAGVARHPGDKGMKYIADRIIECINFSEFNTHK